MPENKNILCAALRNVPRFSALTIAGFTATRLGGLTNLVYRIELEGEKLIVRIPGEGTNEYISRTTELHNARLAAKSGVSAQIIWADAETGIMISECIEPAETMTPALFSSRSGAPARAATAFRKLHQSGEVFEFRFELFAMIDDYLKILSGKSVEPPEGYAEIVKAAAPIKILLEQNPVPLAPCHCDPLCENFLDDGTRMWIVDWEYSGMNDPLWDLGDLSVEAGFSVEQDEELLHTYFGGAPTDAQRGRMVIYKAMCDLLWTLWGLIQHADGNPAEDFWAYSVGRFDRCKTLMLSAEFAGHLSSLRGATVPQ
jgi:thiamine kinase-like enzyme